MSNATTQVTDATFDTDVLGSSVPVLVDYWAEWCGPCKMISPMLEESAANYAGRLTLAKLNVATKRARYVGRPASASTAAGLMSRHMKELQTFLDLAFA